MEKTRAKGEGHDASTPSMQVRLAVWRTSISHTRNTQSETAQPVSHDELLRDAILILQGIDGHHIQFVKSAEMFSRDRLDLSLQSGETSEPLFGNIGKIVMRERLGVHLRDQMLRLGELGWLYLTLGQRLKAILNTSTSGTVELALCHHLQRYFRPYDDLLARLEALRHGTLDANVGLEVGIGQSKHPTPDPASANLQSILKLEGYQDNNQLTLGKLQILVTQHQAQLRLMTALATATQPHKGGALLSCLHSYTQNGDPYVSVFASELLEGVSQPFFHFLSAWIYDGELSDPNGEFFIERRRSPTAGKLPEASDELTGWSSRYFLKEDMIPSFLEPSFAHKIFSTGRSLNYLKYACADLKWVAQARRTDAAHELHRLTYSDLRGLKNKIDEAYQTASRRLFRIFFDKYKLLSHLRALKDYLLLGRGDFVGLLIDNLGSSLSRPANTLYRHMLTAALETAIRSSSSSVQEDEVVARLDARMLPYGHGEIGWDVFELEYKVSAPINVILDERSMSIYSKLFSHLWRIKRVEFALLEGWKRIVNDARWYAKVVDLQPDIHRARLSLAEMLHFVRELEHFCHLEVIDCAWSSLATFIDRGEGDLDALINAHADYINRLASKALFRVSTRADDRQEEAHLMQLVRQAFKTALLYCETLQALCNLALSEASRRDGDLPTRVSQGQEQHTGLSHAPQKSLVAEFPPAHVNVAEQKIAADLNQRMRGYSREFQDTVQGLVTLLAAQPDLDLRFLSCRLNFSLFYLVGKSKK